MSQNAIHQREFVGAKRMLRVSSVTSANLDSLIWMFPMSLGVHLAFALDIQRYVTLRLGTAKVSVIFIHLHLQEL